MKLEQIVLESGVVLKKNNKFWGVIMEDGQITQHGWTDIKKAKLSDPTYCKRPSDMTYKSDHNIPEMETGSLVQIQRITGFVYGTIIKELEDTK